MSLVRNERIKLVATALNNVGIATIVTALIVPGVSSVYNPSWPLPSHWWLAVAGVWLVAGISLHLLAIATLGRLAQ